MIHQTCLKWSRLSQVNQVPQHTSCVSQAVIRYAASPRLTNRVLVRSISKAPYSTGQFGRCFLCKMMSKACPRPIPKSFSSHVTGSLAFPTGIPLPAPARAEVVPWSDDERPDDQNLNLCKPFKRQRRRSRPRKVGLPESHSWG